MITIILAFVLTVTVVFFLIEFFRCDVNLGIEVAVAKAWQYCFLKLGQIEKKEIYLKEKSRRRSGKRIKKKNKNFERQAGEYAKKEAAYMEGRRFGIGDALPLFGYRMLSLLKLDSNSDIVRSLIRNCELSGFLELGRNQETNGKRNAVIYANYLLASVISYLYMGLMVGIFLMIIAIAMGNQISSASVMGLVVMVIFAILGYLPLDEVKNRTALRTEEIERDFPNIVSKLVLLLISGMNVSRAMQEAAFSGDSLIYREFQNVVKECSQSVSMTTALIHLQCRCENKYLDKLVTIISKSYRSGNANLADDISTLNAECWLEKKHTARRMMEKVQNKLFLPTMIMFVGILVIIIVPVMSGFNL